MRLLHYSPGPIAAVRSVAQSPTNHRFDKPLGLWLSVEGEDDWPSWCKEADYGDPAAQLCYEVHLAPNADVLHLATSSQALAFTRKYAMDPFMGPMAGRTCMSRLGINWPLVAETYSGVIIAPYRWDLRMDERTFWYYSWDCASGCIWDAEAIAGLTLVRPAAAVAAYRKATEGE